MPEGGVRHAERKSAISATCCQIHIRQSLRNPQISWVVSPVSFFVYFEDVEAPSAKAKANGITEHAPLEDMFVVTEWDD